MKYIISFLILLFLIIPVEYSFSQKNSLSDCNYKIIFWGISILDMEILHESTYPQLISRYQPLQILCDEYIYKYYWDEQLIEFEYERMQKEMINNSTGTSQGLFSIVLNSIFIFHGLNRLSGVLALKQKYDDSDYPTITSKECIRPHNLIYALKPKYNFYPDIFRDYDENEQIRILSPEVLKYFETKGKAVRGKIDLRMLLHRKHLNSDDIPIMKWAPETGQ